LKWRARPQCLHRQLKCLRVSKTESYGLSRICFEMTRQATMPSSKAWLCLADEQHKKSVIIVMMMIYVLFICFVISSSERCLRVSKTESYGLSRICFEMTRQATMPSSSEKCLRVSKTESYGLRKICFEMTRQATMPSSKAWLCLADEQHISRVLPIVTNEDTFMLWAVSWFGGAGSWGRIGRYINCPHLCCNLDDASLFL
jgi:hypothetical protein